MDRKMILGCLLALLIGFSGCTQSASNVDIPDAQASRVSPPADPYPLQPGDLEKGWTKGADEADSLDAPGFDEGHKRSYYQGDQLFDSIVYLFNTTQDARKYYQERADEVRANYSTAEIKIADGGISWSSGDSFDQGLVRDRNTIVRAFSMAEQGRPDLSAGYIAALTVKNIRTI